MLASLSCSTPQRHHLPAVDHDGGARHVSACLRGEQQQWTVEVPVLTEAADRDLALDGKALRAGEILAIDVGHEPSWRDAIDPDAFERQLEAERLGDLNYACLRGRIGDRT